MLPEASRGGIAIFLARPLPLVFEGHVLFVSLQSLTLLQTDPNFAAIQLCCAVDKPSSSLEDISDLS